MIAQFPRLDQMRYREEGSENDADPGYDHVSDAEEGIATPDYGAGADDD
jgi:hypothetical protein